MLAHDGEGSLVDEAYGSEEMEWHDAGCARAADCSP